MATIFVTRGMAGIRFAFAESWRFANKLVKSGVPARLPLTSLFVLFSDFGKGARRAIAVTLGGLVAVLK